MSGDGEVVTDGPTPPPRIWTFTQILAAKENRGVALKLVFFTVLMITMPVLTFFCCHDLFFTGLPPNARTLTSGMVAVLAVNVVIFLYVVQAMKEDQEAAEGGSIARSERNHASWATISSLKTD
ncbi:unnamed protein product [Choristocarpus tenellus]